MGEGDPQAAAAAEHAKKGAEGESSRDGTLRELAVGVLTAAAAGISTVAIVSAVGGIILFERFSQAQLPAEEAVAVQPRSSLLVVGAETLVPLTAAVLAFTSVYYGIAQRRSKDKREAEVWIFAGLGALASLIYYLVVVDFSVSPLFLGLAIVISVGTMAVWALLAGLTRSRAIRALLLAAATALAGAALGLIRTIEHPKLRAAAVLLTKPKGAVIDGVLVAETSDRIYVGQVRFRQQGTDKALPNSGAVVVVDRSEVAGSAFGTNEPPETAMRQGAVLAQHLRAGMNDLVVTEGLAGGANAPTLVPHGASGPPGRPSGGGP